MLQTPRNAWSHFHFDGGICTQARRETDLVNAFRSPLPGENKTVTYNKDTTHAVIAFGSIMLQERSRAWEKRVSQRPLQRGWSGRNGSHLLCLRSPQPHRVPSSPTAAPPRPAPGSRPRNGTGQPPRWPCTAGSPRPPPPQSHLARRSRAGWPPGRPARGAPRCAAGIPFPARSGPPCPPALSP